MNFKRGFVVLLVSFVFIFSIFGVSAIDPNGASHSPSDIDWSQSVGDEVTFSKNLNVDDWISFIGGGGLRSMFYGNYFYASTNYWESRSKYGIRIKDLGDNIKGYLYHSGAGNFGLLDTDGSWAVLIQNNAHVRFFVDGVEGLRVNKGSTTAYGNLYASGGTVGGSNGLKRSSCYWEASPWSCVYDITCATGYYQAGFRMRGGNCPASIYCCKAA